MRTLALAFALLLPLTCSAHSVSLKWADAGRALKGKMITVQLNDGSRWEGHWMSSTADEVTLRLDRGDKVLERSQIDRLQYRPTRPVFRGPRTILAVAGAIAMLPPAMVASAVDVEPVDFPPFDFFIYRAGRLNDHGPCSIYILAEVKP